MTCTAAFDPMTENIKLGSYTMHRRTVVKLMASTIVKAYRDHDRPVCDLDFLRLGLTPYQITELGPLALSRAVLREPRIAAMHRREIQEALPL